MDAEFLSDLLSAMRPRLAPVDPRNHFAQDV